MSRECKCCGKQIEEEQLRIYDKCIWCSNNCLGWHESEEKVIERYNDWFDSRAE